MKRALLIFLSLWLALTPMSALAGGEDGTDIVYLYDYKNTTVPSLASYRMEGLVFGQNLGMENWVDAADFFITERGIGYLVDSGHSRIVGINLENLSVVETLDGFYNGGVREEFNKPQGVFVTDEGDMYIADTQNKRIVHLNANRELVKIVDHLEADVIAADYEFKPRKLAVDEGGRIYAVAEGTVEGLVQISSQGEFISYFGSNQVRPNAAELLLRMFLTREQRKKRSVFLPVEYSNVAMDKDDFLYTMTVNTEQDQVSLLNFAGSNILRHDGRMGNHFGDIHPSDKPYMVDVTVDDHGNFTALDTKRGRLYQYDPLGQLLAIFGGQGDQSGQFRNAVAVDQWQGKFYVLDGVKNSLTILAPTEFGQLVLKANNAFLDGEYDLSRESWREVLRLNSQYDLAYKGLGDAYYKQKDYEDAIACYRRARSLPGYSRAYDEYRTQWLRANFSYIMSGLLLLVAILVLTSKPRARLTGRIKRYFDLD